MVVERFFIELRDNPQRLLGKSLLHQERFTEAATALEKATKLEPSKALGRIYLTVTYDHVGELQKAKTDW